MNDLPEIRRPHVRLMRMGLRDFRNYAGLDLRLDGRHVCLYGANGSGKSSVYRALRLLADDLAHYCLRDGRRAPPLALSRAQRRWGSCAADGAIRINWRLIMAPDAVRRSVVAHEVAHLTHFDHSPAFHAHLGALFEGDVSAANRWLKREGRSLYAHFG